MSPKNLPLIVGLAAPGLLWLATSVAFSQDPPPAPPGLLTPAPSPSSPDSKSFRALLLSNGKVVRGDIVEDTAAGLYRLRQRSGSIGYPRIMVQKAANSVEELYQFQAVRLPEGDPDERMKLARWCLTEHLTALAKEQLEAIKALCPNDSEVQRMLYNLAATSDRAPVDPGISLTSGEMPIGEAPATLDPGVITRAQKRFNALPEIFDLPQAQAVKRANEFVDYVQPVLQQSCARCHNEKYQGDFQLVEVKARRGVTSSDTARANLDATLRLINPDDPARSPLLSAGLVPHGGSKSAIFRGPNDRNYQVLQIWAKTLKATRAPNGGGPLGTRSLGDGVARTGYAQPDNAPGDGFATDRPNRQANLAGLPAMPEKNDQAVPTPPPRAKVEQIDESADFANALGDRPVFPTPYLVGAKPTPTPRPAPPRAKAGASSKPTVPGVAAGATRIPAPSAKTATPVGPNAVVVTTDNPNDLPGMDQPRYPPKPEADADGEPADKKKTKAIDPALLEKMMRTRNGGTP